MKAPLRFFSLAAAVSALSALALPAQAQTTFIKADNTTSLNLAGSYTSNSTVPTSLDTIQVDTTLTQSRTSALGGNLSINALTYNASQQFQISNTANATLTIGAGGITKSTSTNLIFANSVTLGASQTWAINSGSMQVNGAFSDGGNTLAINGVGTLDLRGSNTFGSNVVIDTSVSVNLIGSTVTFGGLNTFNALSIPAGRVRVGTIGNFGQASNAGDGGTNTAIILGNTSNGIFEYTGSTASTNRTFSRDARSAASGIEVTTAGQTLTVTGNMGSGTQQNTGTNGWVFSGAGNLTLTGVISNTSNLTSTGTSVTKDGLGTLTMGGASASTYTGATNVNLGTLIANTDKALGNTSAVNVAGGTLDIRGATAGTVTIGAAANLSFTSGVIKFQLGTAFDQLVSSGAGAFTISGGTFQLDVTGAGFSYGNTYAILSGFGGSNSVSGLSFTGFDTAGYTAALGTNGVLSFTAIPEPSTWALLLAGATTVVVAFRRRRQA